MVTPRKPEAKREEEDEQLRPLDRGLLDIVGPTVEAPDRQCMLLTTRDLGSNMKRVEGLENRTAKHVLESFLTLYPGARHEIPPRFPREITCDNDRSFLREFKDGVVKRGGEFTWAVPRRPQTNARAEVWHKPLEESVAACLRHANGPAVLWVLAAKYVVFVWARQPDARRDQRLPYTRFYEAEPTEELYPFGCLVLFLLGTDERNKMEERRARGALVGYAAHGAFKVLEVDPLRAEKRFVVRVTRDVRVDPSVFPLHEIPDLAQIDDGSWSLESVRDQYPTARAMERLDYVVRANGDYECTRCHRLITNDPI